MNTTLKNVKISSRVFLGILLISTLYLNSCTKNEEKNQNLCYEEIRGLDIISDTSMIFPLGTRNFWIYDDSLFSSNTHSLIDSNYLLTSKSVTLIDKAHYAISFDQFINTLTIINDTLYKVNFNSKYGENCVSYSPFLFRADTLVEIDKDQGIVLYPASGSIPTKIGQIPYDYIYEYSSSYKYYIHHHLGIIRMEQFDNGQLRRSKTLNNYFLYK